MALPPLTGRNALILGVSLVNPIVNTNTKMKIMIETGSSMATNAIFDITIPDNLFYQNG